MPTRPSPSVRRRAAGYRRSIRWALAVRWPRWPRWTLIAVSLLLLVLLAMNGHRGAEVVAAFAVLDPILSTLVAAGVILLAGRSDRFSRSWILSDLRYASHLVAHRHHRSEDSGHDDLRHVADTMRDYAWARLREHDLRPADLIAVLDRDSTPGAARRERLREIVEMLLAPGGQRLVARLLYRAETEKVREDLRAVRALLKRDDLGYRVLERDRSSGRFADWASALLGSAILADGVGSRSGTIARFIVDHQACWVGPKGPESEKKDEQKKETEETACERTVEHPSPHALRHREGDCAVTPETEDSLLPGDYDGRILHLRSVRLAQHDGSGELVVKLETAETCYRVTEDSAEYQCKHLPTMAADQARAPVCRAAEERHEIDIASSRTLLLNSILIVVSITAEHGARLVLSQRSDRARNAVGVISATAGGVFEHRRPGDDADCDEFGTPDLLNSVLREAREELGITFSREQVAPLCVYVANIQGRPQERDTASQDPSAGRRNGQLVATGAFLTITAMSVEEIARARMVDADWVKGRFELDHPVTVDLPEEPRSPYATAVAEYACSIRERAGELDLNAMVGALYAGVHFYGERPLRVAIQQVFTEPWWSSGWSGDEDHHRLVVDPRVLYDNRGEQVQAAGAASWTEALARVFGSSAGARPYDP